MGRGGVRGHEGPRQMGRGDVERGLRVGGERQRHANRTEDDARLRALVRRAAMRAVRRLAALFDHCVVCMPAVARCLRSVPLGG